MSNWEESVKLIPHLCTVAIEQPDSAIRQILELRDVQRLMLDMLGLYECSVPAPRLLLKGLE